MTKLDKLGGKDFITPHDKKQIEPMNKVTVERQEAFSKIEANGPIYAVCYNGTAYQVLSNEGGHGIMSDGSVIHLTNGAGLDVNAVEVLLDNAGKTVWKNTGPKPENYYYTVYTN